MIPPGGSSRLGRLRTDAFKLGFGTWRLNGRDCEEGVADALAAGYRHVDTAAMYGNEEQVGRALTRSGVERSEVWITTKVWPDDLEPERLRASCERSLRGLGTDHVDLLLIHWPSPDVPLPASLGEMVALRERGLTREIGVSNFSPDLFREALKLAPVMVNQVEYNAFIDRRAELEVCAEHDVELTAWRPVAKGAVFEDETIRDIAAEHGATPAQVALRWLIDQPPVSAVPKASSAERRRENLGALELELRPEERGRIDALSAR